VRFSQNFKPIAMTKLLTYAFLPPAILLLALSLKERCQPAWEPDAGLVRSFTEQATVTVSSDEAGAAKLLDGDNSTAWQSDAPFPEGYIRQPASNVFLEKATRWCRNAAATNPDFLTDGDLSSAGIIEPVGGRATLTFDFGKNIPLHTLSLKYQTTNNLELELETAENEWTLAATLYPAENFSLKKIDLPGIPVRRLRLRSSAGFEVFEIAGLAAPPTEWAILDLGQTRPIGVIHTRHWAGENAAIQTKLYLSNERQTWTEVATLEPAALHTVITMIDPEIPARFIKIEHTLTERDWNKVYLWEIKAYDRHGHYGERPQAHQSNVNLREMLGVNGYWSWGTDEFSDKNTEKEGPLLYSPVASHARNYHNMTWDLNTPGEPVDFSQMAAGKGTPAKEWLDWDREYKAWRAAGMNVQASLQFYRFDYTEWKNPYQDAYDYAEAFTRHFGARNGNGFVCTIEAGNEPWKYPAGVYRQILLGMAQGARSGDPTVEVFPCALQAADPGTEQSDDFKNYMGARITPEAAALLDGINVHAYSWATNPMGVRRAVHPEHPNSSFWELNSAIRWRNRNMPGKKIYLSEWGWDAPGAGEDCTHNECVSEEAAAAYAVRAALIAARLGIDRATWFFYANEEKGSSLFTRSGLTGSVTTGFQKKKPFHALESLVRLCGDKFFLQVVREDETAWLYLLGNADGKPTHLVAWKPIGGDDTHRQLLPWKTTQQAKSAVRLTGDSPAGTPAETPANREGRLLLEVGAAPLLVFLE
jgi:hypothetical protein